MAHCNRERVSDVEEIVTVNGTFYNVQRTCEIYDDCITPAPRIEAITEERPATTPAVEAVYTKDAKGKLKLVREAVPEHTKMTKGEPALYNSEGEMVKEGLYPVPVMEIVIVKSAVEAVTDAIEFCNYHRCVIDASGVIPDDVHLWLDENGD